MNRLPMPLLAIPAAARAAMVAGLALPVLAFAQQETGASAEQTVTVSGSRLPSTLRAMPQSVQLIDAEDI